MPLLWTLAVLAPLSIGVCVVEALVINPLLVELALQFLVLSLLSIGRRQFDHPEMHLRAVDIEHWMTDADFSQMFALSQAAPGPNVLIVSLIGWKVAGIAAPSSRCLRLCAPSSVLTYQIARLGIASATHRCGSRSNAGSRP